MKKLIIKIKSLFTKIKIVIAPCKIHVIEEGWMVQQVRFRECINCKTYESSRGRDYKELRIDNCIYIDGTKLTY